MGGVTKAGDQGGDGDAWGMGEVKPGEGAMRGEASSLDRLTEEGDDDYAA